VNQPILHIHNVHFARGGEIWPGTTSGKRGDAFNSALKRLSRRALVMAGPDDAVIVDEPVEGRYLDFLRSIGAGGATVLHPAVSGGISLMDDVLRTPGILDFARGWPGAVEPYIIGRGEEKLMQATGRTPFSATAEVVEILNDKVFFLRLAEDLGLAIVPNFVGDSNATADRLRKWKDGPVIVRGARSVGGSRVFIASGEEEREKIATRIARAGGGLYIVQGKVETRSSPNLQFYVTPGEVTLFGETLQLLTDGFRHTGNLFGGDIADTARDEIVSQGVALAKETALLGYTGVLGVDFIVTVDGSVYAVEFNARSNTSTSAIWFMNRFFTGDPLVMSDGAMGAFVRLPSSSRDRSGGQWLDVLGNRVFDPATGTGIIPYDTGGAELTALIVGKNEEERARLVDEARNVAEM
jgi:hypothetical protein